MALEQELAAQPVLLEGDLLDLWIEAEKRFSAGIKPEDMIFAPQWVLRDPGKWPEFLKDLSPKGNSRMEPAYGAVGRHIQTIQLAVQATTNIFQLVSAVGSLFLLRLLPR